MALSRSANIWIDGSLRDGEWYRKEFVRFRKTYPQYRIAIFYVFASEQKVWERCERRAKETGRTVPRDLIRDSLENPARSLGKVAPFCDVVARIDNEESVPRLVSFETFDRSGDFTRMGRVFRSLFELKGSEGGGKSSLGAGGSASEGVFGGFGTESSEYSGFPYELPALRVCRTETALFLRPDERTFSGSSLSFDDSYENSPGKISRTSSKADEGGGTSTSPTGSTTEDGKEVVFERQMQKLYRTLREQRTEEWSHSFIKGSTSTSSASPNSSESDHPPGGTTMIPASPSLSAAAVDPAAAETRLQILDIFYSYLLDFDRRRPLTALLNGLRVLCSPVTSVLTESVIEAMNLPAVTKFYLLITPVCESTWSPSQSKSTGEEDEPGQIHLLAPGAGPAPVWSEQVGGRTAGGPSPKQQIVDEEEEDVCGMWAAHCDYFATARRAGRSAQSPSRGGFRVGVGGGAAPGDCAVPPTSAPPAPSVEKIFDRPIPDEEEEEDEEENSKAVSVRWAVALEPQQQKQRSRHKAGEAIRGMLSGEKAAGENTSPAKGVVPQRRSPAIQEPNNARSGGSDGPNWAKLRASSRENVVEKKRRPRRRAQLSKGPTAGTVKGCGFLYFDADFEPVAFKQLELVTDSDFFGGFSKSSSLGGGSSRGIRRLSSASRTAIFRTGSTDRNDQSPTSSSRTSKELLGGDSPPETVPPEKPATPETAAALPGGGTNSASEYNLIVSMELLSFAPPERLNLSAPIALHVRLVADLERLCRFEEVVDGVVPRTTRSGAAGRLYDLFRRYCETSSSEQTGRAGMIMSPGMLTPKVVAVAWVLPREFFGVSADGRPTGLLGGFLFKLRLSVVSHSSGDEGGSTEYVYFSVDEYGAWG